MKDDEKAGARDAELAEILRDIGHPEGRPTPLEELLAGPLGIERDAAPKATRAEMEREAVAFMERFSAHPKVAALTEAMEEMMRAEIRADILASEEDASDA